MPHHFKPIQTPKGHLPLFVSARQAFGDLPPLMPRERAALRASGAAAAAGLVAAAPQGGGASGSGASGSGGASGGGVGAAESAVRPADVAAYDARLGVAPAPAPARACARAWDGRSAFARWLQRPDRYPGQ